MIGLIQVYKFSSTKDKLMVLIGIICSMLGGLLLPSIAIIMGELIEIYDPYATEEQISDAMIYLIKVMAALASAIWVLSYMQYAFM
jgi:hypothetical protein